MCGAPVPKMEVPPQKAAGNTKGVVSVLLVILFAAIVGIIFFLTEPSPGPVAPPQRVSPEVAGGRPAAQNAENLPETGGTRPPPHELITDPGLRQALELVFRREIRQIGWDEILSIRTFAIGQAYITMSSEVIPLAEIPYSPYAVRAHTDSPTLDARQMFHFENLIVMDIAGQVAPYVLERLTNIQELRLRAGYQTPDFTHFAVLPNLQRLDVSGQNLTSLEGISDLGSLYALSLTATGLQDLSVLSFQRNITELALVSNPGLSSFNSLREMTWLSSLHIERSQGVSLDFIRNMANLESLTIIRTDTRSYDFVTPLTQLRRLHLTNNRDALSIPFLAEFTELEELYMDRVGTAEFLSGLTSLRKVTLYGLDSLEYLRGMQNLEELNVNFGWNLSNAAPLGDLNSLRTLRINESRTMNPVENMDAIGGLTNLRQLDLSGNTLWFNWDFIYRLTQLEKLNISNNTVVGDFAGIRNLSALRVLHMDRVRLVPSFQWSGSGGMISVSYPEPTPADQFGDSLAALSLLEELSISGNRVQNISFVSEMQNLRYLYFENNYVTDISPLADLPNLTHVDLRRNAVTNWDVLDEMINISVLGR